MNIHVTNGKLLPSLLWQHFIYLRMIEFKTFNLRRLMCMERESRRLCQISRKCIAMEKWGNLRSSFIGLVCTLLYYRVKYMCTSSILC